MSVCVQYTYVSRVDNIPSTCRKIRAEDYKIAVFGMHFYQSNNISLSLTIFYPKVQTTLLLALAF
jgi:hypothetical protein